MLRNKNFIKDGRVKCANPANGKCSARGGLPSGGLPSRPSPTEAELAILGNGNDTRSCKRSQWSNYRRQKQPLRASRARRDMCSDSQRHQYDHDTDILLLTFGPEAPAGEKSVVRRLQALVPMLRKSPLEYCTMRKNVCERGALSGIVRESSCLSLSWRRGHSTVQHVLDNTKAEA